jgi:PAB-dependent poly(A)-specific ribonuclease subunit 2
MQYPYNHSSNNDDNDGNLYNYDPSLPIYNDGTNYTASYYGMENYHHGGVVGVEPMEHHYDDAMGIDSTLTTMGQQHQQPLSWKNNNNNPATRSSTIGASTITTTADELGSYYPTTEILSPLLYGVAPISAVAYDMTYDAITIATDTLSSTSTHPSTSSTTSSTSTSSTTSRRYQQQHLQRSAMLVTHHGSDGSMYSAVAGHPEAPAKVLQAIYSTIYGPTQSSIPTRMIPNHAYVPTYGKSDPALPEVISTYIPGIVNTDHGQMGITRLLPLPSGTMASVSPAAVRVHANGGMTLADLHLEGMIALTTHPHSPTTHISVGGLALPGGGGGASSSDTETPTITRNGSEHQIHCLDVWQGLRPVTSHSMDRNTTNTSSVAVTCLATSDSRGCLAAGGSDGFVRLIDHRQRNMAKMKSHVGGVVSVAVSDDGTLVATTGYASTVPPRNPSTSPYAFSDPNIFINDIRYLGRGGFPHPFAGLRGGPRFVSFLPDVDGLPSNRILIASGQAGGGCQVIVPFDTTENATPYFILPQLNHREAISCICVSNEKLALGTNQGRVIQHEMVGYQSKRVPSISGNVSTSSGIFVPPSSTFPNTTSSHRGTIVPPETSEKLPLVMPAYPAPTPDLTIDASILLRGDPNERIGINDRMRSIFGSFIFTAEPSVSSIGKLRDSSQYNAFGPLATDPIIGQCRFEVAPTVLEQTSHEVDFVQTILCSDLKLDVMADHRPVNKTNRSTAKNIQDPLQNPNKFIFNNKMYKVAYTESLNRPKRFERHGRRYTRAMEDDSDEEDDAIIKIPKQYRIWLRPMHKSAASYSYFEHNKSGKVPGFDYPFMMPNSFVPPILLLLYFIPEIRDAANQAQIGSASTSPKDQPMLTELGYLFYRIDAISRYAYIYPANEGIVSTTPRIDAWAPLSFISFLSTMAEAERNQILDGSPAAVDPPRRPEAFYRFMLYQLDNEIRRSRSTSIVDTLSGVDFVSINEFISGSGPPTQSTTRHLTVEFTYDYFFGLDSTNMDKPSFGDVLQYNLFRASRLRAWSTKSKSYETIVQRKIATSLPHILSISASCAGRKNEPGIQLWQQTVANDHWLPEMIEIEIDDDGLVLVRELVPKNDTTTTTTWRECRGSGPISDSIIQLVKECTNVGGDRKRRYRLEAVLSMVRDDMDRTCPEEVRAMEVDGPFGHQVLHVRVGRDTQKHIIEQQRDCIQSYLSTDSLQNDLTLAGRDANKELFQKRLEDAEQRLSALNETSNNNDGVSWVAVNGFVVSDTDIGDVRTFDVPYKEPLLVIFRSIEPMSSDMKTSKSKSSKARSESSSTTTTSTNDQIPLDVIRTSSITNNAKSPYFVHQRNMVLPGRGEIVALDTEFVAVAEEESILTASGSKLIIRETRHVIARISVVDGRTNVNTRGCIIFDDHVQPIEPVVDYLTRFSGIVEQDLSPKYSKHHLISNRASYLKLRCLIERGCIFVGHGLQQDFWIANLAVPAHQIIDTVDIYHKPAQRYVSLRFLTNFILKHDVQQDVHDSVEDAMAALELYGKALELKQNGTFDKVLNDLYEYGQKNDWKLGVDDDDDEHDEDNNKDGYNQT